MDDNGKLVDDAAYTMPTAPVIGGRTGSGFASPYGFGQTGSAHNLRRVDTGLSSIVGHGNGDRPGGFILVIDGAALSVVSASFNLIKYDMLTRMNTGSR